MPSILLLEKNSKNIYQGLNLQTGQIEYFTHYDDFNNLYELKDNNYKTFDDNLPKEIKLWLNDNIKKHLKYNMDNNYPLEYMKSNLKNIAFRFNKTPFFNGLWGYYKVLYNSINLNVDNDKFNNMSEENKIRLYYIILHEIGHLKATTFNLYQKNKIKVQVGFYNVVVELQRKFTNSEYTFYEIVKETLNYPNGEEKILEELVNELDCYKVDNNYQYTYPKYGRVLNYLCDNNLEKARYGKGIEVYLEHLTSLIKSETLALELLRLINKMVSENFNYSKKEEEVKSIIKQYLKHK